MKGLLARYITSLAGFGATFITDTCWCLIDGPVLPLDPSNLITNSAKYAHYGAGTARRGIHFGSIAACVDTTVQIRREGDALVVGSWIVAPG